MGKLPELKDNMTSKEFRELMACGGGVSKKGRIILNKAKPIKGVLNPVIDEIYYKFGMDPNNSFFIPGEVMSSKNSHQIFIKPANFGASKWKYNNKPVYPFVTHSDATKRYMAQTKDRYISLAAEFNRRLANMGSKRPIFIQFLLIRATKSKGWDYNNMTEVVQDQMVRTGWIKDDSVEFMLPLPPLPPEKPYYYDKNNPGVFISIISF